MAVKAHYSRHQWHSLLPALFVWVVIPLLDFFFSKNSSSFHPPPLPRAAAPPPVTAVLQDRRLLLMPTAALHAILGRTSSNTARRPSARCQTAWFSVVDGPHYRGWYHTNVATPEDSASIRFGRSIYQFLPRTVVHGYRSAWRLERA